MVRLLQSPLRALVDRVICALRITGTRSNRVLEFPVQYARHDGGVVILVGHSAKKNWWRNIRRQGDIRVWLDGRWRSGHARLIWADEPDRITAEAAYRSAFASAVVSPDDPFVFIRVLEPGQPPLMGRRLWWTWTRWVTLGETVGFVAPAIVGAVIASSESALAPVGLVAAGAVEGTLLAVAQVVVLRRALPAVPAWPWIGVTALAAAIAYVIGLAPSLMLQPDVAVPTAVLIGVGAIGGTALLLTIGTAQWLILRRHVRRAARWIGWTAAGWLLGLGAFMIVAPPLWHEGQELWLTIAIGLGAAMVMAAAVAATTGLGLTRLLSAHPVDR